MSKKLFLTNKLVALDWLNKDYVMCNDLPQIDPELFEDVRRSKLGEEEKEFTPTTCPHCGGTSIQPILDEDGDPTGEWECFSVDEEETDGKLCDYTWNPDYERHPDDEEEEEYPDYDFFQFFITNLTEEEVEFMCAHFSDFVFAYSPLLDCWVWCATDLGTHRSYVMVNTDLECAERKEGEPKQLPMTNYYADVIFNYIRFDWSESEFKEVFPEEKWNYLWAKYQTMAESDKDKAFPQFFFSLDSANRRKLIDRITQKRHLR